jgi:triacylglycerol lipase
MIGAIFSQATALYLARMTKRAYAHDLPIVGHLNRTDTQVYAINYSDHSEVIFPGTDSAQDFLTDIRVKKYKWRIGRVHAGFRRAFESIFTPLANELKPGTRILLAGHSLGGALAMLAAYALLDNGYPIMGVYTYGSPRVGNGPFSRTYNSVLGHRTFRLVNDRDPVPRLPWVWGTYRHAGTEVFLPRDGGLEIDPPWYARAADKLADLAEPTPNQFVSLQAHALDSYIKRLT